MNERRFLYLILTLIFLVLTAMTVMIMITQTRQKTFEYLLEYEKVLNHLYHTYNEGEIDKVDIPDDISSVGLYNFYKQPLYLYGNAPKVLLDEGKNRPHFSGERNTIVLNRDLLNPFIPVLSDEAFIDGIHSNLFNRVSSKSEDEKQSMIRYVYMEITDAPVMLFRRKNNLVIVLVSALILIILLYMGNLYLRNMKYRNQIESQERLVMLGTAARTLTHEVKNPLSSIRLQTSIIKRSGCTLHDPSLKIINEEVSRLAAMTERVGDFLRHPGGIPSLLDLKNEVYQILDKRKEEIQLPDIENAPVLMVRIDPERLKSILDNLLNNALESGSEESDISLTLERNGSHAVITVSDGGAGIPRENMKRIFDPFFTTKSKGSGVGLAIVHSYTQGAGGSVNIESTPENGTRVRVSLPLEKGS
ncbi:sensor histidine kinase [Oceanispirochaeta crateris]|nr:ATP-binding protein [Oceanispirochaeta crateris]